MKQLFVLSMLVLLAGCAPTKMIVTGAETRQEFDKNLYECQNEVASYRGGAGYNSSTYGASYNSTYGEVVPCGRLMACLNARGIYVSRTYQDGEASITLPYDKAYRQACQ